MKWFKAQLMFLASLLLAGTAGCKPGSKEDDTHLSDQLNIRKPLRGGSPKSALAGLDVILFFGPFMVLSASRR